MLRVFSLLVITTAAQEDKVHRVADLAPKKHAEGTPFKLEDHHLDLPHHPILSEHIKKEQEAHHTDRKRNYELLTAAEYHAKIDIIRTQNHGAIVAFVDETKYSYIAVEGALNRAAATFGCLPHNGVYMIKVGKSKDAAHIAETFHIDHNIQLPQSATRLDLPFMVHLRATDDGVLLGPNARVTGIGQWTVHTLKRWGYAQWNVTYLDDETDATVMMERSWRKGYHHAVVGIFDRLCDNDAIAYLQAVATQRELHDPLPAAVSSNHTLVEIAAARQGASKPVIDMHRPATLFAYASNGYDQWFPAEGSLADKVDEFTEWLTELEVRRGGYDERRAHDEL